MNLLTSQVKRCDLCMSFDHFLSLNYELIDFSSLMLGHPRTKGASELPGGFINRRSAGFCGGKESQTPHHSLYVLAFSNTVNTMAHGNLFGEDVPLTEDFS